MPNRAEIEKTNRAKSNLERFERNFSHNINADCQLLFTRPIISLRDALTLLKYHGLHNWSNVGRTKKDLEGVQDRKGSEQPRRHEEIRRENPLSASRARSRSGEIPGPESCLDLRRFEKRSITSFQNSSFKKRIYGGPSKSRRTSPIFILFIV
jgi:hypothetical protein